MEQQKPEEKDDSISGLAAALRQGKVNIKFNKKDGTQAIRVGTLSDILIKESGYVFKEGVTRAPNPRVIVYYELGEKPGFKSFIKDNLVSWSLVKEEPKKEEKKPDSKQNDRGQLQGF